VASRGLAILYDWTIAKPIQETNAKDQDVNDARRKIEFPRSLLENYSRNRASDRDVGFFAAADASIRACW
jgi:hypothetical protein